MRHCTWLLVVAALVIHAPTVGAEPAPPNTLAKGLAQAKQGRKLVAVVFGVQHYPPSEQFEKLTLGDERVGEWLREHAVVVRVDAKAQPDLRQKYRINWLPTVVFLKSDGSEADRVTGYTDAVTFLSDAQQALSGHDTVSRLKTRAAASRDPQVHLQLGDAYYERGLQADALREFFWCFDQNEASFATVRLTSLLARLVTMAQTYPPAMTGLVERRDREMRVITQTGGTTQSILDVVTLNRALRDGDRNLALFDQSPAAAPRPVRQYLADQILPELVAARRYQEVLDNCGSLDDRFADIEQKYADAKKQLAASPLAANAMITDRLMSLVLVRGALYYECLVGTRKASGAQAWADRIVALDNHAGVWELLIEHAQRAGDSATAHHLAETAYARVDDSEKGTMVDVIQRAFKDEPEPSPTPSSTP